MAWVPCRIFVLGLLLLLGGCATPADRGKAPRESNAPPGSPQTAERARPPEIAPDRWAQALAHYATGISLESNGDEEGALEEFSRAALAAPEEESLVFEVVRRRLQREDLNGAYEVLERASVQPEASARVWASLGFVLDRLKKREEARRAYTRALKRDPFMMMAYQGLLTHHLQDGKTDRAAELARRASRQASRDPAFWIDVVDLYLNILQVVPPKPEALRSQALEVARRAQQLKPANPVLIQRLAEQFKALGEPSEAATLLEALLEQVPSPILRERLADAYLRQGKRDLALQQLEHLKREFPANPQVFYVIASVLAGEKKLPEAIDALGTALKLKPDFEQAYYDLVGIRLSANQVPEALKVLEEVRTRFKPGFMVEFFTALTYSRAKDYNLATNYFYAAEAAAQQGETNRLTHAFYFQMGAALERSSNYVAAESYFRQALQIDPDFAEALNYLGYMWADRGERLPEARKLIERAVALEPNNAAYLDSLAWVLYRLGRPRAALPWMLKAVRLAEEPDSTLYDHLGDIYQSLKRPTDAAEAWRKSLEVEPDDQVQQKLDSLRPR
jgi:tetratricopeptide (TPR) repeat protein